jgi:tetratricopeptide (TPR) repeat protein
LDTALILTILGIIVTAFIPLTGYLLKTRRQLKNYYSLIWKSSSSLKEKDLLGERPYNEYYLERSEDALLKRNLERRNNVLLIGPPLMGKTRAVYEQLKKLREKVDVLTPRAVNMPSFLFPKYYKLGRNKLIFIDDLQYYIEKQDNYHMLFKNAKEEGISIAATCHSGQEFKKVKNKMIEQGIDIDNVFGENIIEYEKVSPETGKQIADKLGMKWDSDKFNGTIGSIFMRLSEMERRYFNCSEIEKNILISIRMMYITGLYTDNNIFSLEWIKLTAKRHELEGKDFEWTGRLRSIEGKEFIKIVRRNKIWAEDAYLEYIVKPDIAISDFDIFEEMTEVFSNEPDALLMLGERAYDIGSVDINIAIYMRIAIKAFEQAITGIKADDIQQQLKAYEYAGRSYWNLSRIEDLILNNQKALQHYNEAIKLIDKAQFPFEYARIQNRIGNSYSAFATIGDEVKNCARAIKLYKESLEYFTIISNPIEYSRVNNNLGAVYQILSQVKEPGKNLKLAIECLKNALKIRTPEKYPKEYGDTCNNLGNTYAMLSDVENKSGNLKLAIEYYDNFLRVSPKEKNPLGYSLALTNLGITYSMLAAAEDTEKNCRTALSFFEKALEIRTPDRFPVHFATVQFNIGETNLILAGLKRNSEICFKAIDAYEESLAIKTKDKFPSHYGLAKEGLGDTYIVLAGLEDKSENYERSISCYNEALSIFTEESYPGINKRILDRISKAKKIFF